MRQRDLERFLTFVDAVVAIAITLLVLPLVELSSELGGEQSVADLLQEHRAQLAAFLLSFLVIARLWFIEHGSVRHVVAFDRRFANLTMLWVLTIVFLPFPTSLVAEASDDPTTKILYVGTMALGTACLALSEHTVVQRPQLSDGRGLPDPAQTWANVVLMALALALMLVFPSLSYLPLLLLVLDRQLLGLSRRLLGRTG